MSWRGYLRRAWWQRERAAELEAHVEAETDENLARGLPPAEARAAAERKLGNRIRILEDIYEANTVAWLDGLVRDLRLAARQMRRAPGFTTCVILILALGLGASAAMFSVVEGVLLRPVAVPHPNCLLLLSYLPQEISASFGPRVGDRDFLAFRERTRTLAGLAGFTEQHANLSGGGLPARVEAVSATVNLLPTLERQPERGRNFLPSEEGSGTVAMVSEALWRSRYGADPHLIGATITVDGKPRTVVGVLPPGMQLPADADVWLPLKLNPDTNSRVLHALGRLKPGVSWARARAELSTLAASMGAEPRHRQEFDADYAFYLATPQQFLAGDVVQPLVLFSVAIGLLLLIVCANVANLLLMRAAGRRQEMAVRMALGAGRARLVRQVLTESALLALSGGVLGMLVAAAGVPALLRLAPVGALPRLGAIRVDGGVLLATLGLALACGLLFGLAPAWRLARADLAARSTSAAQTPRREQMRLRAVLVVAELALALLVLAGAGLLLQSMVRLQAIDPGFDPAHTAAMTVALPSAAFPDSTHVIAFERRLVTALQRIPGVASAAAASAAPLSPVTLVSFKRGNGVSMACPIADLPIVSSGYFHTLGTPLLAGRDFRATDHQDAPKVAIVNRALARECLGGGDPVGQRLSLSDHPKPDDWITIVGEAGDIRQEALTDPPRPALYLPYGQCPEVFCRGGQISLLARSGTPTAVLLPEMRRALAQVNAALPPDALESLQQVVDRQSAATRFETRLLMGFAAMALLLAALGVYAVLAYSVGERRREIAIRMALGASAAAVAGGVLRQTLMLVLSGIALGLVASVWLGRYLRGFLYAVRPGDPSTLAAVALLLTAVALLAAWLPARRAARMDPMSTLREE